MSIAVTTESKPLTLKVAKSIHVRLVKAGQRSYFGKVKTDSQLREYSRSMSRLIERRPQGLAPEVLSLNEVFVTLRDGHDLSVLEHAKFLLKNGAGLPVAPPAPVVPETVPASVSPAPEVIACVLPRCLVCRAFDDVCEGGCAVAKPMTSRQLAALKGQATKAANKLRKLQEAL